MKHAVVAALAVLAVSIAALAAVEEAIQVVVVEVPVVVTDGAGKAVRGLTAENFQLFDNGKRIPIEHFEVIDLTRVEAGPLHPAARRNFLLMFDLSNSSPGNIGRARKAAEEFVVQEMGPRDLAAVATFTVEQGIRLLTAFTADRALLRDAIVTLGHPRYFRVSDPLFMSATVAAVATAASRGGEGSAEVDASFNELLEAVDRAERSSTDEYRRGRLKTQLQHFGQIARVLDRLKGQKQVVLFSEGFEARLVHGQEQVGGVASMAQADAAFSGEVWKIDSDQRYGSSTSMREMSEMAEIFRRSDVVLHAVDVQGLRSDVDVREGARRSSNEALFLLSNPTGGTVFKNANDLGGNLRRMLEQQEVIYVLGFRAAAAGRPGSFHDLKVRTTGVRAAKVTHRAGYYEHSPAVSPLEKTLSVGSILVSDVSIDEIGVSFGATPFPGRDKHPVSVVLEIAGPRLLEGISSRTSADIFIYAFDEENSVSDFIHQTLPLDLARVGKTISAGGLRYQGTLMLDPGVYTLKALVRVAESERTALRNIRLEVPRFEGPTVAAPMLLSGGEEWLTLRAPARPGTGSEYPFVVGTESFVPDVDPALAAGSEYKVAVFTWHMPPEGLQFRVAVENEAGEAQPGEVSLLGRTPPEENGSVKYLFRFTPGTMPPGKYRLRFTMVPPDAKEIEASMPFAVAASS